VVDVVPGEVGGSGRGAVAVGRAARYVAGAGPRGAGAAGYVGATGDSPAVLIGPASGVAGDAVATGPAGWSGADGAVLAEATAGASRPGVVVPLQPADAHSPAATNVPATSTVGRRAEESHAEGSRAGERTTDESRASPRWRAPRREPRIMTTSPVTAPPAAAILLASARPAVTRTAVSQGHSSGVGHPDRRAGGRRLRRATKPPVDPANRPDPGAWSAPTTGPSPVG